MKGNVTPNTKTYSLCVFVFRVSWDLMSYSRGYWDQLPLGFDALHFWYKYKLVPWKWWQCVLPKRRCGFFLFVHDVMNKGPAIFTSNVVCMSENRGRKTLSRIFVTCAFTWWCVVMNVICRNGSNSCEFYDRGWLNPTRGQWKMKAVGRRDDSNYSLVKNEITNWPSNTTIVICVICIFL